MRAFRVVPRSVSGQVVSLSRDGLRRLVWIDWYHLHNKNAESTCRHFSISKSVFYRWLNRFNRFNLSSLEFDTRKRRPHNTRVMTTPREVVELVYRIRSADPEKSKYEIQAELREEHELRVGYNTIQKIINRDPRLSTLSHKRKVRKHRNMKIARIKAAYELKDKSVGSLVQVDTKYFTILGCRFYIFAAIDCKSRYAYTFAYTNISSKSASDFLGRVRNYFPFTVEAINTDNGSEYLLYFHKLTQELNIPHYFSHPHTPTMNSRVERLIQTLEYEFLNYQNLFPEISCVRSLCETFNHKYNQKRYHRALNYQTPQKYVTNYQEKGGQPFSI